MNIDDAKRLLAACAAFDNRQPSLIAARAWAKALEKVPLDQDAFDAVARYYGTEPARPGERLWIQPADVIHHRNAIQRERLANFIYEPEPDESLPGRMFVRRYRQLRDAVASGRVPGPLEAPALSGGPHPSVVKGLEDKELDLGKVGRAVPGEVAEVKRPGPLGQECPQCGALIGRPCRIGSLGKERRPHPVRVENAERAAKGLPPVDLEARRAEQEAEAERRREVSRRALEALREREAAAPSVGEAS